MPTASAQLQLLQSALCTNPRLQTMETRGEAISYQQRLQKDAVDEPSGETATSDRQTGYPMDFSH